MTGAAYVASREPPASQLGPELPDYTSSRETDRHGHHAQRSRAHRRGARSRSPGPTRSSSSIPAAPTTPSRSRGGMRRASRCATGRATARRRTTPRSSPSNDWILSLDADERVTPELAPRSGSCSKASRRPRGYRIPRVTLVPRPVDPHDRLVSRLPAAAVRSPRRPLERPPGARVGRAPGARPAGCATSCSTTPTATSPITSRRSTATRRSRRSSGSRRAAGPTRFEIVVHPRLAFLRNYVLRGGIRDGAAGLLVSALNSYYVFLKFAKLWELQQRASIPVSRRPTIGIARSPIRRSASPSIRAPDVLAAHRHGADVAGRAEPGAGHGDGPARARPSDAARRALRAASCGSARRKGST